MDPIHPWLDPVDVRRMADRLLRPHKETGVENADAGFDQDFVGFATNPAAGMTATGQYELPPRQARIESPFHDDSPPLPVMEPTNPATARGPFLDRIKRFRDWMRHHFSATGVFILDREGSVIFDESTHGRLHFLARSLALASRRPGTTGGNVHVKIGAGATLEVIPVDTAYGWLVLGAVVPDALTPASVIAVMEGLSQIASPPLENP